MCIIYKRTVPHTNHGEPRRKPRGYKNQARGVGTYNRKGKGRAPVAAPDSVSEPQKLMPCDSSKLDWDAIFSIRPPFNFSPTE